MKADMESLLTRSASTQAEKTKTVTEAGALRCIHGAVTKAMLFSYLSMFLLFALRRATMPALASASRENGSIPYRIKRKCLPSILHQIKK